MRGTQGKAKLLPIFLSTLKLGAFTFGGGYAMIPLMQREFVDKHAWVDNEDILDIFAVAQSVPGVIAINSSVMIGYRIAGLPGGLMAALGVSLPSLIILILVTLIYQRFIDNPWVQAAMRGVRAGVVALIVSAVLRMRKEAAKNIFQWILLLGALAASIFLPSVSAIVIILAGGLLGFLVDRFWVRRRERREGGDAA
jgi:chromate transporter